MAFGRRFMGPGEPGVLHPVERTQGEESPFSLALISQTLIGTSRSTKAKVAELSKKPETLNHPQAARLCPSLVCACRIFLRRLSEDKSTDNVLVVGKITLLFHGFYMLTVWRVLEVESAQRKRHDEHLQHLHPGPPNPPSGLEPLTLPDTTVISIWKF